MPDQSLDEISTVIPYLYYEEAKPAIEYMKNTFGFSIVDAFEDPESGAVLHATVHTGKGIIFVGPGMEPFGTEAVRDRNVVSSMTYVFVDDVEAHFAKAKACNADIRAELHDHFGGNRQYTVSDPGGHRWTFAEPIKKSD